MRNEKLRKQMGLYRIEIIDNLNICKSKYFEKLRNRSLREKISSKKVAS